MGKSKTKHKTKKKKQDSMIRTDVWTLKVTSSQKQLLLLTVAEYRKFLKPLVFIVNKVFISQSSTNTLRTPVCLGTLRSLKTSGCQ